LMNEVNYHQEKVSYEVARKQYRGRVLQNAFKPLALHLYNLNIERNIVFDPKKWTIHDGPDTDGIITLFKPYDLPEEISFRFGNTQLSYKLKKIDDLHYRVTHIFGIPFDDYVDNCMKDWNGVNKPEDFKKEEVDYIV